MASCTRVLKPAVACLLLLLWSGSTRLAAQLSRFRHYSVNDGLAGSCVYYCMQDTKGYIWFCTETGVSRFDGRHFETFTTSDGLADNETFKCFEDHTGRIWFMSYNGKLSYYKDTGFVNGTTDPGLIYPTRPGRYIADMVEDGQGNIWFTEFLGDVYKYDGRKVRLCQTQNPNWFNKLLFRLADGRVYALDHAADGKAYRYNLGNGTQQQLFTRPEEDWSIGYACRQTLPSGALYFSTSSGLKHLQGDSLVTDIRNSDLQLSSSIGGFRIIGDHLWVCAGKNGLFFVPDFLTKGFRGNYEHRFSSGYISFVMPDHEGGVWATSLSDGIYYMPASESYITNIPGLSVTSVSHERTRDLLAVGTYYGNFSIRSGDSILHQVQISSPIVNRVKALKWLSPEKLLIGTDNAPYTYDLRTRQLKQFIGQAPSCGFCGMDENVAGLWYAGRAEIFLIRKDSARRVCTKAGFIEKIVSVAAGAPGECWFADIKDLYHLDVSSGKSRIIASEETFHANLKDIRYVQGELWIATDGNGIFIFRNGRLQRRIYVGNKEAGNICQKLVYDGQDHVWVATSKGILVYDRHTYTCIKSYTSNDILINDDIKDICLDSGKAYVATPSGVSVIDIHKFVATTPPPVVHIRSLTEQDKRFYQPAAFPYFKGVITVSFTAITYQANQSLRYRYKIDDRKEAWNETSADRVEFYNLEPGTYTLLVSARKYNSDWSRPVTYTFTVLPLWYQSWWFKICLGLLLAGILYVWIGRIRRNEKQKTAYNKKIAELRSNALAGQMNPHFIFNTLNSLQTFVLLNKPLAANYYIARFSTLIRWIMSYADRQEITLERELEFLHTYIELEQLRFEEQFEVQFEVDDALEPVNTCIPSLVIQPFVENAIKYGLTGKKENGLLRITFKKRDQFIHVTIEDNGVGRAQVQQEQLAMQRTYESTGIKNTEARLRLIGGSAGADQPVGITDLYDNNLPAGTRVTLIIPILK